MRHTLINRGLLCLLCVLGLSLLTDQPGAQTFTPVKPCTAGGVPQRPGEMLTPGQSATIYFQGHTGTATLDPTQSTYDAVAWLPRGGPIPDWWAQGLGGEVVQCQPNMGDAGGMIMHTPLPWGPVVQSQWGYYCIGYWDPDIVTVFHSASQPNAPVCLPDPCLLYTSPSPRDRG